MKRFLSLVAIVALGLQVSAQEVALNDSKQKANAHQSGKDGITPAKTWTKGGVANFSLTQVGNSNWMAASGDKFTLSAAASLNVYANKKWGRKSWDNILDVNYGLVNTSSLGVRKINDRLDFLTKFSYQPKKWKKANIAALAQLRSQLSSGYEYNYFGSSTVKRRTSGFFAPAYVTVAPLGVTWTPNSWFSLYGSPIAARWIIVSNGPYSYAAQGGIFNGNFETPLASLYGVNPAKQNRGEFGTFVTATLKKEILKNVGFYSKLDLYSNYIQNAANIDIFWTNQFRMKVNKWLQVSYTLDMLYDDDVKVKQPNAFTQGPSLGLQVLSTLGVGVALKF